MSNQPLEIKNEPSENRYVAKVDGQEAELTYRKSSDTITFLHTGVPASLEGHGIASELAKTALDEARAQKLKVVPQCPFVASYIQKHPEYQNL